MTDLPRRSLTAAVYGIVVIAALFAPEIVFYLLLAVIGALGLSELLALRTGRPSVVLAVVFLGGLASLGWLREIGAMGARHGTPEELPVWLLSTILPTWGADVSAYAVGSMIGRRRLAPTISPGKTWEGTIAGWVACAAIVIAVASAYGLGRPPFIIIALGLGPVGLAGDLLESYVKRRAGVKDSGRLLPGHGGILDRLDSLTAGALFVLAVYVVFSLVQLGSEGDIFERF